MSGPHAIRGQMSGLPDKSHKIAPIGFGFGHFADRTMAKARDPCFIHNDTNRPKGEATTSTPLARISLARRPVSIRGVVGRLRQVSTASLLSEPGLPFDSN